MSSGLQRSLSFSIHLRKYGWNPVVLTANPGAYERTSPQQLQDIPADMPIARTRALDAARHLSFRGRYWSRLALPDRWRSWWLTAVPGGAKLIRRHAVSAIWSTYPIATAHSIAATLARRTGLPWIADFRDPMVEFIPGTNEAFPKDPALREARLKIEAAAAQTAAKLVFCTVAARRITQERYGALDAQRLAVIPNGYEEQAFSDAERLGPPTPVAGKRVLLHSGIIYRGPDRDPTMLMKALRSLSDRGLVNGDNFELRLRDPANEDYFRRLAADLGVANLVTVLPPLPYREALAEMLGADALLLLQGQTSNPAVPAKLYEYLRARRAILALVHPDGETAATLRSLAIDTMAPLTDESRIAQLVSEWLRAPADMHARLPSPQDVSAYSRDRQTAQLAQMLDEVTSARSARSQPG